MKSWFIGTVNLRFSAKNNKTYLEGWDDKVPILGFEDNKIKNTFHLILDSKKLLPMLTHQPEGSKENDPPCENEITKKVARGSLKLKISKKSANRMLKGLLARNPVIGWEDKKIKNKFHLVIDDEKLDYLRSKNPNGAHKAEIETKI